MLDVESMKSESDLFLSFLDNFEDSLGKFSEYT